MIREVLMTKEEYEKLKKRFVGWLTPRSADFKINEDKIRIDRSLVDDKITYFIIINGKYCSITDEKMKLYGFETTRKGYKGTKEELFKDFIKIYGKKKGKIEAERYIKERKKIYYMGYCESYSAVERMLKKYKEVYWLKEEYEE